MIFIFANTSSAPHNARPRGTFSYEAITFSGRLLGNAARLFTTAVESGDAVLLLGYGASFTLNGMLAWQIRAYVPRKED